MPRLKPVSMPLILIAMMTAGCSTGAARHASTRLVHSATPTKTLDAAPRAASPVHQLRVMSYNVRVRTFLDVMHSWSSRRAALAEVVRGFTPDVMGTQECLAAQLDDLRGLLPQYDVVAAGRNDGRRSGEMCAIFYRRDRFVSRDAGHFWLSESPADPGSRSWGAVWPRMTSWVRLAPLDGGAEFFVFNSHFPVFSAGARDRAAELLNDQIRRIVGECAVVITGDFNTDETSDAYRILRGDATTGPWRDAYRFVHPQPRPDEATRHAYRGTVAGRRIDWIFATRDLTPLDADILHDRPGGRFPSDHYPVTAVFARDLTPTAAAPITAPRRPGAG